MWPVQGRRRPHRVSIMVRQPPPARLELTADRVATANALDALLSRVTVGLLRAPGGLRSTPRPVTNLACIPVDLGLWAMDLDVCTATPALCRASCSGRWPRPMCHHVLSWHVAGSFGYLDREIDGCGLARCRSSQRHWSSRSPAGRQPRPTCRAHAGAAELPVSHVLHQPQRIRVVNPFSAVDNTSNYFAKGPTGIGRCQATRVI